MSFANTRFHNRRSPVEEVLVENGVVVGQSLRQPGQTGGGYLFESCLLFEEREKMGQLLEMLTVLTRTALSLSKRIALSKREKFHKN